MRGRFYIAVAFGKQNNTSFVKTFVYFLTDMLLGAQIIIYSNIKRDVLLSQSTSVSFQVDIILEIYAL